MGNPTKQQVERLVHLLFSRETARRSAIGEEICVVFCASIAGAVEGIEFLYPALERRPFTTP